jgi:hypothetical protein
MLLNYRNVETLAGLPWYALEMHRLQTAEGTVHRVVQGIPQIFKSNPCQLLVPLVERDLDKFTLSAGEFLFVRSADRHALLRLRGITGIAGLVTSSSDPKSTKAIAIDDAYVQEQTAVAKNAFYRRSDGIAVNSFVRVLNGGNKNYCGRVVELDGATATVEVALRSKVLTCVTALANLKCLDDVPPERQVFFHCDLIAGVPTELLTNEPVVEEEIPDEPVYTAWDKPGRVHRINSLTGVVRQIIQMGCTDQEEIVSRLITKIKSGEVQRLPVNSKIIFDVIKANLLAQLPIKNWRTLQRSAEHKIDLEILDQSLRDSGISLPMFTPAVEKRFHRPRKKKH